MRKEVISSGSDEISCVFVINFFKNCLPFYLSACRHAFDVEGCNWKPFRDLKLVAFEVRERNPYFSLGALCS